MKMLVNMKKQFAEQLYDKHFLNSTNVFDRESNRNSDNEALVRAVICAGLYPNVAKLKNHKFPKGKKGFNMTKLTTESENKIIFHPKSVNDKEVSFPYPWVVYHLKIKSQTSVSMCV